MAILDIEYYNPYNGLYIENNMVNVTHGDYPCMEGQHFRRAKDSAILRLVKFEWYPTAEKVISGVIIEDLVAGESKRADITYFLEALKTKRLLFYSPESKPKFKNIY